MDSVAGTATRIEGEMEMKLIKLQAGEYTTTHNDYYLRIVRYGHRWYSYLRNSYWGKETLTGIYHTLAEARRDAVIVKDNFMN
jgi:hypothetical protein